ncbi:hypothetical protein F4678DRAFT_466671 [Xylaria arbuscula]|nr:hypothetical protein F4678DRAFT_466671 [Xylaria arbuscula]
MSGNDLHSTTARNFLGSFSAEDTAKLPSTLEPRQKLELLSTLLQDQLAEAASKPPSLPDPDFATWEKLHFGIYPRQNELGDYVPAKARLRMLVERRKDKSNLSLSMRFAGC